jgi:tetratricopeptide (TPR) repeat protein
MKLSKLIITALAACMLTLPLKAADLGDLFAACDAAAPFEISTSLDLATQAVQQDANNFECQWRLCRAQIDTGEMAQDAGQEDDAEAAYAIALATSKNLVEQWPNTSMAHYYRSLALGRRAMFAGGKEKVKLSQDIEKHALKALQLDPNNARAHGLIGRYYREMAHLSWVMRTLAETLFGELPEGGDDLSLSHLRTATELKPDWIFAWVELGETCEVMEKDAEAKAAFTKALSLSSADHRDPSLLMQAKARLKDLN